MSENHLSSINNAPSDNELSINIIAKLDNINCTMLDIKSQQVLLETKIEKWNDRITNNQNEIHLIYRCLRDSVIPSVLDIIKIVFVDAKQTNKQAQSNTSKREIGRMLQQLIASFSRSRSLTKRNSSTSCKFKRCIHSHRI